MNDLGLDLGDALARMLLDLPSIDERAGGTLAPIRDRLARARLTSKGAVRNIESSLGYLDKDEESVLVDLFFAYRSVNDWEGMIALHGRLPLGLANARTMQEQLAFALNRAGHRDAAERILLNVVNSKGASSETYGLLGRVRKDRWDVARREGRTFSADGLLDMAIEAYMKGVEANPRDVYPGINALTLMELGDRSQTSRIQLLPVVRLAAEQRLTSSKSDYWDHATLLEMAVIGKDETASRLHLDNTLNAFREPWERVTTARNLFLLRRAREERGEFVPWTKAIEKSLLSGNDLPTPNESRVGTR